MTAPSILPPSVVAMLDTAARDAQSHAIGTASCHLVVAQLDSVTQAALAHAIGRDAAAHYDRERLCLRCCVAVADPADPMRMCGPCAEIDARP